MTTEVVTYARDLAERIRTAGVRNVSTQASGLALPGVLVVPIPERTYDIAHGYSATWSILCIVPEPGDERAAQQLDELVAAVDTVVPLEHAAPEGYVLPNTNTPAPAYRCRFTTEVERHP